MISSFRLFDPTPCGFPKPRVPLLPPLSRISLSCSPSRQYFPLGQGKNGQFYSRGRYALHEAFRLAGVGNDGALLAPAYHCRTMIDPAVRLGGDVLLYELDRNLAPAWPSLADLADRSRHPVRALLLTHYFGLPQDIKAAQAFCTERGIALIEDCSHAYLHSRQAAEPGTCSQYVVASPYKFAPCEDGGLLIAGAGMAPPSRRLHAPGIRQEIRALACSIERALAPRSIGPTPAIDAANLPDGVESDEAGDTLSSMYDPRDENTAGLRISRLIMRISDADRIAEGRRTHYRQWVRAVAALPGCHALFPELPAGCVPYMFPLYIDHPNPHFHILKHLGIPIWRWDEMANSHCRVAADYRLNLLHLPCHQGLGADEMQWMIDTLSSVLTEVEARPCP